MIDFGAALRRARESAGLTQDDIFARTRISLRHLRAIESGDFPSVPQTYIRAFIREYARAVGLDEQETLTAYNDMAEAHAGIPRPPDAIDASNILPQRDDSIEIIGSGDAKPVHVEVLGNAEVAETEPFVPPVRKSSSVTSDQETIDIRTVALRSDPPTQEHPPSAVRDTKSAGRKDEKRRREKKAGESKPEQSVTTTPATRASAEAHERKLPVEPEPILAGHIPPPAEESASPMESTPTGSTFRFSMKPKNEHVPATTAPSPPDRAQTSRSDDEGDQRRILMIGSVVVLIIIVALYAVFHFSSDESSQGGMIDSTAIRASIDAGKFIDSSQNVFVEPELPTADTSTQLQPAEEKAMEPAPQVFAKDDSLVLEAFSNSPVWFSVRMDTTRTERGQLSSNDHRVWKARDRFVITLGDAGAVTFFLNGREIGALGDEGAVIKNVTLSRQSLHGEQ